jgi:SNF2 family DNA or RNA helicase
MDSDELPLRTLLANYSDFEIPSKIAETVKLTQNLLDSGKKVLIWTSFVHNIRTLEGMLKDRNPLIVYGEIPKDNEENEEINREKRIKEFKEDKSPRVLIANPNSLAESISLHKACKEAIYLDRTFNAGQYIQSLDRIHRIGLNQGEEINYHILISKDTIDETVDSRLNSKIERLYKLLNDELPIMNMGSSNGDIEVSDSELELDFRAVYDHLRNLPKSV